MEEVKRSAYRKGVIQALTLCKVYHPNVDPSRLTLGFTDLNVNGSKYQPIDYYRVAKDMWHHTTKIADDLKLDSFEPGYDEKKKKAYKAGSEGYFPEGHQRGVDYQSPDARRAWKIREWRGGKKICITTTRYSPGVVICVNPPTIVGLSLDEDFGDVEHRCVLDL